MAKLKILHIFVFFLPCVTNAVLFDETLPIFIHEYFSSMELKTISYISCDALENDHKFLKKISANSTFFLKIIKKSLMYNDINQNIESGVLTSTDCLLHFQNFLDKDTQRLLFRINIHWLIINRQDTSYKTLDFLHLGLASDVKLAYFDSKSDNIKLIEFYKIKMQDNFTEIVTFDGNLKNALEHHESRQVSRHRNDLKGVSIRCARTVAFPEVFTSIDDLHLSHIDTYAKGNWPIVLNLQSALNFTLDLMQVDSFGWNMYGNGSFTGLIGLLQRREIEFGASASLMRHDRIPLVDRAGECLIFKAVVIFRQPPLSTISNIFVLPFNSQVWICLLMFFILSVVTAYVQIFMVPHVSFLDSVIMVFGAICQQGTEQKPRSISGRVVFWTVFIISVFIFTSYSACIVALLQSPSNAIKTVDDLIKSPIKFGAQNQVYNHVYLKESTSPTLLSLYNKKIVPNGNRSFSDPDTGMFKVQHELYAFQIETHAAYKYIKSHFYEYEKCQLGEIELFKLPVTTIPVQKDSQYRELFSINLRWQREIGLIDHATTKWIGKKEKCRDHAMHFNSVGTTESKPAFLVLLLGMSLALLLFVIELFKAGYDHACLPLVKA